MPNATANGAAIGMMHRTRGFWSTSDCRHGPSLAPGARFLARVLINGAPRRRCNPEEGADGTVASTMVACLRLVIFGKVITEVRTFQTTTADLLRLSEWLATNDCTHGPTLATPWRSSRSRPWHKHVEPRSRHRREFAAHRQEFAAAPA